MTMKFYPGCKIRATYPQESKRLLAYLAQHHDIQPMGCCRKNWEGFCGDDQAVVVCNNCHEVLSESSEFGQVISVWTLIDQDPDFPFPDYSGKELPLVDCWIATGNHEAQDMVRRLMKKMNIKVIELEDNKDDSRFCGTNIISPASPSNLKLAPRRWGQLKDEQIPLVEEGEWDEHMQAQCAEIPGGQVACYCKFCADGLRMGGKEPLHLIQLLFPE